MQDAIPDGYLPDEHEPDLFHALPELHYPEDLNAACEMVDRHVEAGRGDEPAIVFGDSEARRDSDDPSGGRERGPGEAMTSETRTESEANRERSDPRGPRTITYEQLRRRVDRAANALLALGVEPGDRVFVRFPNRPEYVVCCLATQKIGAITVPSMKLLRADEIAYVVDDAAASVAIVYDDLLEEFEIARDEHGLETLEEVVVVDRDDRSGDAAVEHRSYDDLVEAASPDAIAPETCRDDLAMIAYTSGTTGEPKGTVHTHRQLLAICDGYARYCLDPGPADVFASNAPIAFTFGYGFEVAFPLRFGATTVLMEDPTPKKLLEAVETHDVSILASVPTAYNQLFAEHEDLLADADVSSLRRAVSAGEPLPPKTFEQIREYLGVDASDGIGSTEMLHIFISHRYHDEMDPTATGVPVPGYEAKVIDPDTGEELPRGEPGLLLVRGPTGVTYWNRPEKQREAIFDGWSAPGDVYVHREDGRFEYVSRWDDLIVTGGHNVAGPEVEDVLLEREEVYQAAVVGSPDEQRGQLVKAFVVLEEGHDGTADLTERLQAHVKDRIAPFKYPREIEYVDDLPTTETGKIQRATLREREREGGDAASA
ncbi:acyl-CoA synthetase [Halovivax sp.]|uniref:acyl-CoA synthetase n=1 Tax=Halovivax sp. TaxID=1935978 RepID=UPI0025C664DF|nr:acyl-CoA synthetase [Halovivax sp.]